MHLSEVHLTAQSRHQIGADHAQQDGDDLEHALAPDIEHNHDGHSQNGDPPVGRAVVHGAVRQRDADADDDGAGHDRREVTHDLIGAKGLEQHGHDHVQQTRARNADARIGNPVCACAAVFHQFLYRSVAAQECEGGTQERGHLPLGQQVEQQRAQTGEQQRRADAQTRQGRHQHRCAKHGENMLEAQQKHFSGTQLGVSHG